MIYIALALLSIGLVVLSWFDIKYFILPDILTLPLLWLGLLCSLFGWFTTPAAAIIGAVSGYMFLWIIAKTFKLLRGRDGMGHGDFKLLALFGAWFGWQVLPFIICGASLLGIVVAVGLKKTARTDIIPFGPCIAIIGWSTIFWGHYVILFNLLY